MGTYTGWNLVGRLDYLISSEPKKPASDTFGNTDTKTSKTSKQVLSFLGKIYSERISDLKKKKKH